MDTTFHLNNNIVPQNFQNNVSFWFRLEVFVKDTMTKQFHDVYVVTGPAFIPYDEKQHEETPHDDESGLPEKKSRRRKFVKYEVLGDNNVAVPTHLFKVILVSPTPPSSFLSSSPPSSSSSSSSPPTTTNRNAHNKPPPREFFVSAFLVPNEKIPSGKQLEDYEVPIEYLEKQTGLRFFRNIDRHKETKSLCKSVGCKVMSEAQLEYWNFSRRIDWAKTKDEAEQVWNEMHSKGYEPDDRTKRAYNRKMAEFL